MSYRLYEVDLTLPTTDEVKYCESCVKLIDGFDVVKKEDKTYEIRVCRECQNESEGHL
jgi:hypothetical protein